MAELLVRIVDKSDRQDASKAGDVICVCPDGWVWSQRERSNPAWIIVQVPGVAVDTFADLLDGDRANGEIIRRRSRSLDLTRPIIANAIERLGQGNRVIALGDGASRLALLAARVTKPAAVPIVRLG